MTLLDAALAMHYAGLTVIPVRNDGSKAPAVDWKNYQDTPPSLEQLHTWFTTGRYDGLGAVCGRASGNLEMLEVEGRATGLVAALAQMMRDNGFGDLWDRLCTGYLEQSPSGGMHWLYRVDGPDMARGNTKLARRPGSPDPTTGRPAVDVLIETRGEGGFTVTAPSAGRAHPTGAAWRILAGTPATIPNLTPDERDALYAICSTFDQMPAVDGPEVPARPLTPVQNAGERPGDDYNNRATWDDILTPHGWTRAKHFGGNCWGWTRPGKHPSAGISATTGRNDGDNLYVWSSSTEFDAEKAYSKFAAYTLLAHGGDYTAAARRLRSDGYGKTPERDPLTEFGTEFGTGFGTAPRPVLGVVSDSPEPATGDAQQGPQTSDSTALAPAPIRTVSDSEDAHAHRLIASYGPLIRYVPARKLWLVWNGTRWTWQPPGGGEVREYAKNVARALTDNQVALAQRRKALSSAGITGCLKQAETDARVCVDMADLDSNPFELNTPAGVVDLRTGHLTAPTPDSLCTKTTTVAPATIDAFDPIWERFLNDTFGADYETRAYVQRLVGLTLIGQVREQLLAFLHGTGANGKSTLAETLMHTLGTGETGYATAAPSEMLMIRKHSEHPAELAQLAGARMVVCSELDDGQRFAESRIKHLTGRDSINARFLYGQPFTFTPTHTIWLLGNHRPQARTGGEAFWRRVKLVEFPNVVPAERRDPALGDKLNAAAGTVLAWAIAGAVDYLTNGIREPAGVAAASKAYADDQDTVGRFVADECHRADSDLVRITKGQLRSAYEHWCREVGEEPASPKRFGQELRDRFGVGDAKSNGRQFYTRICLLEVDEEPPDESSATGPEAGSDRTLSAADQGWLL